MAGTIGVPIGGVPFGTYGSGVSVASRVMFQRGFTAVSLLGMSTNNGEYISWRPEIWDDAGNLLATGPYAQYTVTPNTNYEFLLTTPINLQAGVWYRIGFSASAGSICFTYTEGGESTPPYAVVSQIDANLYTNSQEAYPNGYWGGNGERMSATVRAEPLRINTPYALDWESTDDRLRSAWFDYADGGDASWDRRNTVAAFSGGTYLSNLHFTGSHHVGFMPFRFPATGNYVLAFAARANGVENTNWNGGGGAKSAGVSMRFDRQDNTTSQPPGSGAAGAALPAGPLTFGGGDLSPSSAAGPWMRRSMAFQVTDASSTYRFILQNGGYDGQYRVDVDFIQIVANSTPGVPTVTSVVQTVIDANATGVTVARPQYRATVSSTKGLGDEYMAAEFETTRTDGASIRGSDRTTFKYGDVSHIFNYPADLAPGTYRMRARTADALGVTSAWSGYTNFTVPGFTHQTII